MIVHALFVSHRGRQCGVHHFGVRLFAALAAAGMLDWHYAEAADVTELTAELARYRPDIVLFNHHPSTLPFVTDEVLAGIDATTFGILHEAAQETVERLDDIAFDYLLCADPTMTPRDPRILPVPRFAPHPIAELPPVPDVFTVGSFGFGTPGKGFGRLCSLVNEQFDVARIRINIPPHDSPAIVPPALLHSTLAECHAAVTKPGIALEITNNFFDDAALLAFLAENTINAFLYDPQQGRGISSCTDHALAARRPIAVSESGMFRNLHGLNPTIVAARRPLRAIAADGFAPLAHLLEAYRPEAAGAAWDSSIREALARRAEACAVPDARGFNKLLDDDSRAGYAPVEARLRELAPDIFGRKIPRANVQQAFAFDTAHRFLSGRREARILAVGSFEDTAVASLRAEGYALDEVDPEVNGLDLDTFYLANPAALGSYDLVLCVSVLEHVRDDESFVRMVADLLTPGGVGIFTVDYSAAFPETGRAPGWDERLYTRVDLRFRLMDQLPDCALVDPESWSKGGEDFDYEEVRYAFASWVFRKRDTVHGLASRRPVPAWSRRLAEERHARERAVAAAAVANDRISEVDALADHRIAEIQVYTQQQIAAAKAQAEAGMAELEALADHRIAEIQVYTQQQIAAAKAQTEARMAELEALADHRIAEIQVYTQQQITAAKAQAEARMAELATLRASTSWKVTRPLRGVRRLARMFRRGGV
jgi:SAM-dependent methyltransferase